MGADEGQKSFSNLSIEKSVNTIEISLHIGMSFYMQCYAQYIHVL